MESGNLEEKDLERYGVWVSSGPDGKAAGEMSQNKRLNLVEIEGDEAIYISEEEEKQLEELDDSASNPPGQEALDVDSRLKTGVSDADVSSDIPSGFASSPAGGEEEVQQKWETDNVTAEDSSSILSVIEKDLKSLRGEIFQLRTEIVKMNAPGGVSDGTEEGSTHNSGFFDDEEDETIALSDTELTQVLDSADMKVEETAGEMGEENSDESLPGSSDFQKDKTVDATQDKMNSLDFLDSMDENFTEVVLEDVDSLEDSPSEMPLNEINSSDSLDSMDDSLTEEELLPELEEMDEIGTDDLNEGLQDSMDSLDSMDDSLTEEELLPELEEMDEIGTDDLNEGLQDSMDSLDSLDENFTEVVLEDVDSLEDSPSEMPLNEINSSDSLDSLDEDFTEEELPPELEEMDEIGTDDLNEGLQDSMDSLNSLDDSLTEEELLPELEEMDEIGTDDLNEGLQDSMDSLDSLDGDFTEVVLEDVDSLEDSPSEMPLNEINSSDSLDSLDEDFTEEELPPELEEMDEIGTDDLNEGLQDSMDSLNSLDDSLTEEELLPELEEMDEIGTDDLNEGLQDSMDSLDSLDGDFTEVVLEDVDSLEDSPSEMPLNEINSSDSLDSLDDSLTEEELLPELEEMDEIGTDDLNEGLQGSMDSLDSLDDSLTEEELLPELEEMDEIGTDDLNEGLQDSMDSLDSMDENFTEVVLEDVDSLEDSPSEMPLNEINSSDSLDSLDDSLTEEELPPELEEMDEIGTDDLNEGLQDSMDSLDSLDDSLTEEELPPELEEMDEIGTDDLNEGLQDSMDSLNSLDDSLTEEELLPELEEMDEIGTDDLNEGLQDSMDSLDSMDENFTEVVLEDVDSLEDSPSEMPLNEINSPEQEFAGKKDIVDKFITLDSDYEDSELLNIEENNQGIEETTEEYLDIPPEIKNISQDDESETFDEGEELEITLTETEWDESEDEDTDSEFISLDNFGFDIDEIENPEATPPEDMGKTGYLKSTLGLNTDLEENLKILQENSDIVAEPETMAENKVASPESPDGSKAQPEIGINLELPEDEEDDYNIDSLPAEELLDQNQRNEDTDDVTLLSLDNEDNENHDSDQEHFLAMADQEFGNMDDVDDIKELSELEGSVRSTEIIDYESEDMPGITELEPESLDEHTSLELTELDIETEASPRMTPEINEKEIRDILQYMDSLLGSLPREKIQEFSESQHFGTYKKIFEELGIPG